MSLVSIVLYGKPSRPDLHSLGEAAMDAPSAQLAGSADRAAPGSTRGDTHG